MKHLTTITVDGKKAEIFKGKPLADVPKTYKFIKVCSHSVGNLYNSSTLRLYKAADSSLRYEIYRDGCFYPYYGKLVFLA
jgi:hypothetical protein